MRNQVCSHCGNFLSSDGDLSIRRCMAIALRRPGRACPLELRPGFCLHRFRHLAFRQQDRRLRHGAGRSGTARVHLALRRVVGLTDRVASSEAIHDSVACIYRLSNTFAPIESNHSGNGWWPRWWRRAGGGGPVAPCAGGWAWMLRYSQVSVPRNASELQSQTCTGARFPVDLEHRSVLGVS